jgi:hypothetical protein
VRVTIRGGELFVGSFRDGNHNGVRAMDIANGVDPQVAPDVGLGDLFSGVRVGAADGAPPAPPEADATVLYSFGPTGTSSSGTVYLRGRGDGQYAVRVLGATGRVRVLRFRPTTRDWVDIR